MDITFIKIISLSLTFCCILPACHPLYYTSNEISAQVIDTKTKIPVQGAIVLVGWEVQRPKLIHGSHHKSIKTIETTTNHDGYFTIPSWGPIFVGSHWHMTAPNPFILIYKEDYMPFSEMNYSNAYGGYTNKAMDYAETWDGNHVRTNIKTSWNNQVLEIEPVTDNIKYAKFLSLHDDNCNYINWKETPLCIYYFSSERRRLSSIGVRESMFISNDFDSMPEDKKAYIINKVNLTK